MNTFDCYAIADSLLAGNQAARLILVDWLSDVGDDEEANFIRRASSTRAGDLDVALRQIPSSQAVELGCEFLEHSADHRQMSLHSLLDRVRRLLRRGGTAEQYSAASRSLAEYRTAERFWYDGPKFDAVHALAIAVAALEVQSEEPRAAALAVTSTARLLRAANLAGLRVKKRPDQLSWQIKRTRALLGQLAMQGG